ncbi:DUF3343 domain-containing protein [Bacillota bacterium LX-D]|nr:DUF3343 domain-containing protein [Bacillota bacterium LX-D]
MTDQESFQYYILFANHNEGLLLRKELKAAGIKSTIAPTPRKFSKCCGISLLITEEYIEAVQGKIAEKQIKVEGIYKDKKVVAQNWNKFC